MSNDHMSSSEDGDVFLDYMLRSAMTAPGASTSPTAGRILARLLVVIAIEGGAELITPYLAPEPGQPASFEVRTYRPGDLTPTEVRSDLDSVAALRTAIRLAREADTGIEVLSQSPSGLERCVVVRDPTGEFEFRFAGGETMSGDPGACLAARRAWADTLAEWRSWVVGSRPALEATGAPHRSAAAAEPTRAVAPVESYQPEPEAAVAEAAVAESDRTPPVGSPAAVPEAAAAGATSTSQGPARPPPRGSRPLFRPWGRAADTPRAAPTSGPVRPWGALAEDPSGSPDQSPAATLDVDLSTAWRERPWNQPLPEVPPRADESVGADAPTYADAPPAPPDHDEPRTPAEPGPDPSTTAPPSPDAYERPDRSGPLTRRAPSPLPAPASAPDPDVLLAAIREGFANLPRTPTPAPAPGPDPDVLLAAIREGFAGLSPAGTDLTQIEMTIRRTMDTDRRGMVEPLARRLAIVVRETMDIPNTRDVVDSVVPLLPRPGDVADLVSARIADLLSETVLRRAQSETTASPAVSGMMAAVDRFEVQMDGLHDQLRRASGVLETFGDRLEASDRRAAAAERTSSSLEQEMRRLVRRVDEQVAALAGLATEAGGPSEVSDGVSRLTRKLRQSVAQLDRALVRLDLVLDSEGAPIPADDDPADQDVPDGPAGPAGPVHRGG